MDRTEVHGNSRQKIRVRAVVNRVIDVRFSNKVLSAQQDKILIQAKLSSILIPDNIR